MIASAKNNLGKNENTVRADERSDCPDWWRRESHIALFRRDSPRHAVDAMSVLDGGN
jgi:hypothetical protein